MLYSSPGATRSEEMGDFLVQDGQSWVLIGDSITDCGRRAEHPPYGWGYVKMVVDWVTARYPERRITYFNKGIGGNTVEDLRHRWHDDVLALRPDWVSILIGINDLHRTLRESPTGVPPEKYARLYREILERTREATSARIVLMDPFYISTDPDPHSERGRVLRLLEEYLEVVHGLAREFGTFHVPTHALFQEQLRYRPAETFCPEPVHPHPAGHAVIAHGLLRTLGW